jgi:hypothetical protein
LGWFTSINFRCARSTTRLRLGGLDLAIAKYFLAVVVVEPLPCFIVEDADCCLGVVDSFFWMLLIAWDSNVRVAWISPPGTCGMGSAVATGAWLPSSSSFMVGWVRNDLMCGPMSVFLASGLYFFIQARRKAKAPFGSKTVRIFDMVAVRV